MKRIEAIRTFFGSVKPVPLSELKDLTRDERDYFAEESAKELGVKLDTPTAS